jgi:predicted Zn-dependent protease with MMP-like domain
MTLSRRSFDLLVEQAIASLPPHYAQWLDEVSVIVEDHPSPADLQALDTPDGEDGEPLGQYHGGTIHDDSPLGSLPPRVMLYRVPLMEACATRQQLAEEIRKTLLHELGHHAGLDEDDLDQHGFGPMEGDDEIDWDVEDAP